MRSTIIAYIACAPVFFEAILLSVKFDFGILPVVQVVCNGLL